MARPYDTHDVFWSKYWSRIDKQDGCWLWTGRRNKAGYGVVDMRGTSCLAHRLMLFWMGKLHNPANATRSGVAPVMHSCDNPRCVNPRHLAVGSHRQNGADAYARGLRPRKVGAETPWARFTTEQAVAIHADVAAGVPRKTVAYRLGVHRSLVDNLVIGKSYPDAYEIHHGTKPTN